jgi:hypothetical protein
MEGSDLLLEGSYGSLLSIVTFIRYSVLPIEVLKTMFYIRTYEYVLYLFGLLERNPEAKNVHVCHTRVPGTCTRYSSTWYRYLGLYHRIPVPGTWYVLVHLRDYSLLLHNAQCTMHDAHDSVISFVMLAFL